MKLQSKFEDEDIGYGEVFDAKIKVLKEEIVVEVENENVYSKHYYKTFAEFNEDWEDAKEPKGIINIGQGLLNSKTVCIEMATEEEAEKLIEELKALNRLKNNGFEFTGWKRDEKYYGDFTITASDQTSCDDKDLDLLFGGEE